MKVKRRDLSLFKRLFLVDSDQGTEADVLISASFGELHRAVSEGTAEDSERFRGAPRLNNDPVTGETLCIACNLCALACPEHCIEVGWERDAAGKKVLTTYIFDMSRCMFCGLCEDACPTPCLELTQDFEMSLYGRRDMKLDRQTLEEGVQPVIYLK